VLARATLLGSVGHLCCYGLVKRCSPASEEVERFGCPAAGLGAEDGEHEAGVGGELQDLEVEFELADDRVV
jgi:hypothetical protein